MSVEIITREDLTHFKMELLGEIQKLLVSNTNAKPKNWLRTKEVLELLKISLGTLQNYRINGTLKYSRFGRVIYYSREEIEKILQLKSSTN